MRILIVNTRHFYGGGDSTYTFNLADLLRLKGHQVAFFAMKNERNLPDPNSDLFVSHIDFEGLNHHKSVTAGLQVLGRVIYSGEARRNFVQLLDRFKPDIIHLQNIHHHITPSIVFEAKRQSLPVIWTLHDYKLICPNTHLLIDSTGEICEACGRRSYYQAILKRCKKGSLLASGVAAVEAYAHWLLRVRHKVDAFLTPSSFLRNKIIDRGFTLKKVHHLPNFLPRDKFHNFYEDQGYLLFLGRLTAIKGVNFLLKACRLVPDVRLILAGRMEESVAEELPPNAQYVGMKHGEELQRLVYQSRSVILPSVWYENQPYSILEAFACAKPVIASDLGGMSELLRRDGKRGILVPPGNVEALAEAMSWIVTHSAEARDMGKVAQKYAMEEHGEEKHYERLMRIYEKVLEGN